MRRCLIILLIPFLLGAAGPRITYFMPLINQSGMETEAPIIEEEIKSFLTLTGEYVFPQEAITEIVNYTELMANTGERKLLRDKWGISRIIYMEVKLDEEGYAAKIYINDAKDGKIRGRSTIKLKQDRVEFMESTVKNLAFRASLEDIIEKKLNLEVADKFTMNKIRDYENKSLAALLDYYNYSAYPKVDYTPSGKKRLMLKLFEDSMEKGTNTGGYLFIRAYPEGGDVQIGDGGTFPLPYKSANVPSGVYKYINKKRRFYRLCRTFSDKIRSFNGGRRNLTKKSHWCCC